MIPTNTAPRAKPPAAFVTGSVPRHIFVLTGTSAIGLMAVFIGELISALYLGLLRDRDVLAALGFAASIVFFHVSIGIGLSIAATALVAPAVGANDMPRARRLTTHAILFAGLFGIAVAAVLWPLLPSLLDGLGAAGRTRELSLSYLRIVVPTLPLMAVGMTAMGLLRAVGDAERSMNVPLIGAATQLAIDPFFIFMAKLGMDGAAVSYAIGRLAFAGFGLVGLFLIHRMGHRPSWSAFKSDTRALSAVGLPAITANVATPFASLFTTAAIGSYGDAAVAAWTIASRTTPVAFGIVFSLTGAIGPVIGQNLGAGRHDRVRETFWSAIRLSAILCTLAAGALIFMTPVVIQLFEAGAETSRLVRFHNYYCAPLMFFVGLLFVSNAAFNALGHAHVATVLNWGRATLGTIPLVWLGGHYAGAEGVFLGSMIGSIFVGLAAVELARRRLPP
jgi:putative MATE family efflux protein